MAWQKYRQAPGSDGVPFPQQQGKFFTGNVLFDVVASIRSGFDWQTNFEREIRLEINGFLERIDSGYYAVFRGKKPFWDISVSNDDYYSYLAVLIKHNADLPLGWIDVHVWQHDEKTMVARGYLQRRATDEERLAWYQGWEPMVYIPPESEQGRSFNRDDPDDIPF